MAGISDLPFLVKKLLDRMKKQGPPVNSATVLKFKWSYDEMTRVICQFFY